MNTTKKQKIIGKQDYLHHDTGEIITVKADAEWPPVDGLACPRIDGYNDHKKVKGRLRNDNHHKISTSHQRLWEKFIYVQKN